MIEKGVFVFLFCGKSVFDPFPEMILLNFFLYWYLPCYLHILIILNDDFCMHLMEISKISFKIN